jgi:hypothetical protein
LEEPTASLRERARVPGWGFPSSAPWLEKELLLELLLEITMEKSRAPLSERQ